MQIDIRRDEGETTRSGLGLLGEEGKGDKGDE